MTTADKSGVRDASPLRKVTESVSSIVEVTLVEGGKVTDKARQSAINALAGFGVFEGTRFSDGAGNAWFTKNTGGAALLSSQTLLTEHLVFTGVGEKNQGAVILISGKVDAGVKGQTIATQSRAQELYLERDAQATDVTSKFGLDAGALARFGADAAIFRSGFSVTLTGMDGQVISDLKTIAATFGDVFAQNVAPLMEQSYYVGAKNAEGKYERVADVFGGAAREAGLNRTWGCVGTGKGNEGEFLLYVSKEDGAKYGLPSSGMAYTLISDQILTTKAPLTESQLKNFNSLLSNFGLIFTSGESTVYGIRGMKPDVQKNILSFFQKSDTVVLRDSETGNAVQYMGRADDTFSVAGEKYHFLGQGDLFGTLYTVVNSGEPVPPGAAQPPVTHTCHTVNWSESKTLLGTLPADSKAEFGVVNNITLTDDKAGLVTDSKLREMFLSGLKGFNHAVTTSLYGANGLMNWKMYGDYGANPAAWLFVGQNANSGKYLGKTADMTAAGEGSYIEVSEALTEKKQWDVAAGSTGGHKVDVRIKDAAGKLLSGASEKSFLALFADHGISEYTLWTGESGAAIWRASGLIDKSGLFASETVIFGVGEMSGHKIDVLAGETVMSSRELEVKVLKDGKFSDTNRKEKVYFRTDGGVEIRNTNGVKTAVGSLRFEDQYAIVALKSTAAGSSQSMVMFARRRTAAGENIPVSKLAFEAIYELPLTAQGQAAADQYAAFEKADVKFADGETRKAKMAYSFASDVTGLTTDKTSGDVLKNIFGRNTGARTTRVRERSLRAATS